MSITRREIRQAIDSHDRWYQNIQFGFMLETNFTVGAFLKALVGIQSNDKNDVLISSLPDLHGKRVIDIGCNAGLYSVEASCRGAASVIGIDKNPRAIEQAKLVSSIFRRLGRPVGKIEFRHVEDFQKELHFLDEQDVLIAPCVLYHLGPMDAFKHRVAKSRIQTMILQGNTNRFRREYNQPRFNTPGSPNYEPHDQTWGNVLADVPGIKRLLTDVGFRVERTVPSKSGYPVVVGVRS